MGEPAMGEQERSHSYAASAPRFCSCGTRLSVSNPGQRCAVCERKSRESVGWAPVLDREVWDGQHLSAALATRNMGEVFRAYRCDPCHRAQFGPHGITQAQLAGWLEITQAQVSRIECGTSATDHLNTLTRWAQILHIPSDKLWFDLPDSTTTEQAGPAWQYPPVGDIAEGQATSVVQTSGHERTTARRTSTQSSYGRVLAKPDGLERLAFGLHAGMTCELLRLLSMVSALVAVPNGDKQSDQSNCPPVATLGEFGNVAVSDCVALNEHLWRVFILSKSKGAVLPLVQDQFDVLVHIWPEPSVGSFDTYRRLCTLTGELLQLAGEVFFDANQYSDAAYCYTLSATASREADAFDLWACAMTRHAFIEIYERRFDKAASMLELAGHLARRGDGALSTRYWVSSVQAQAFAGLGELTACQRALDIAERVCELSGDASNGGWLRFDGSRLAEERGACYIQLRRPDLAENVLGDALRGNLSARRRASVLTDLAMIGLQRGDVDQLVGHTQAVLDIAIRTGSGFISRKLQELRGHLAPLYGNGQIRELDQQIAVVSGSS